MTARKLPATLTERVALRQWLPYGLWRCADGREVLFNRAYHPLWSRRDGILERADPAEWVKGIVSQEWFFKDTNTPLYRLARNQRAAQVAALNRALDALDSWGCPYGD